MGCASLACLCATPSAGIEWRERSNVNLVSKFKSGTRLYDRLVGREQLVRGAEDFSQVVFPSLKHPQTNTMERQPFALVRLECRFELLCFQDLAFQTDLEIIPLNDRACLLALRARQDRYQTQ